MTFSSPDPLSSGQPHPAPADLPVRIAIRTSPRDGGDFLLVAFVVVIGLSIVATPILLLAGDPGGLFTVLNWLLGIATLILIVFGVVNITAVVVDGRGIRLHRWHGWHRMLAWDRIDAVRRVRRSEALFAAFCTPWRATHWGLSTYDVFCIEWEGRRFYFPPGDAMLFRQAVGRWRPGLLSPEPAGGNAPPREETGNPYQPPTAG